MRTVVPARHDHGGAERRSGDREEAASAQLDERREFGNVEP
jgi:hypothetical protein